MTCLFAGTTIRIRVVAVPKLQHTPSWIPRQQDAVPKQSLPVGRQISAARAPLMAERMATNAVICMIAKGSNCEILD